MQEVQLSKSTPKKAAEEGGKGRQVEEFAFKLLYLLFYFNFSVSFFHAGVPEPGQRGGT